MYKRILLPIDLNEESSWRRALPTAVEYCKAFGSELDLLTVVPDFGMSVVRQYFPPDFAGATIEAVTKELDAFARKHVPKAVRSRTLVRYGTIYDEILKTADETGCDLIVLASHRPELSDFLLGPNAARVVRHSECSVLVVRE